MQDDQKSREQLRKEVAELRRQVGVLQAAEAERQRAEEERDQSRATLLTAIDSLPFDFFAIDSSGRYVLQNAVSRANWGDSLGKRPEEVCHDPDTLAVWLDNNRRAFAGQRVDGVVCLTVGGQERFVQNILVPLWNRGQVQMILGINIDITEHAVAERALQRAREELEQRVQQRTAELAQTNEKLQLEVEERRRAEKNLSIFQKFAEASGQGFAMADLQGRITYVNPKLCQMAGYQPEEMIGHLFPDHYPEEFKATLHEEVLPTLFGYGGWTGESPLPTKSGDAIPVIQSVFLLRDDDGQPVLIANVITDISDRKAAEQALRQSHEELRAIYDSMVDGLVVADIETRRFMRANASMCRMLGYREEELLGMSVPDIHPAEELRAELANFQAGAEGRLSVLENRPVRRKDGTTFYADLRSGRILYNGRPCLLACFRDTTERIEAERAIRQERQLLRNLLAAGDRERQLISYEIHDGLTQQLTGAIMQLQTFELLRTRAPSEADAAFQCGLGLLRASLGEARRLISGVRPPLLDDAGVVAAVENLILETNKRGGPSIELHSDVVFGRLQPVLENAIYRIVQESLTNACRYSRSDRVRLELLEAEGCIEIRVQDWGIGFDPQNVREGCFGLEGIQERARLLGGRATIESQLGRGSLICVHLPLMAREEE